MILVRLNMEDLRRMFCNVLPFSSTAVFFVSVYGVSVHCGVISLSVAMVLRQLSVYWASRPTPQPGGLGHLSLAPRSKPIWRGWPYQQLGRHRHGLGLHVTVTRINLVHIFGAELSCHFVCLFVFFRLSVMDSPFSRLLWRSIRYNTCWPSARSPARWECILSCVKWCQYVSTRAVGVFLKCSFLRHLLMSLYC